MCWISILHHDQGNADKIIDHLSYLLKQHPRKKALKTEINYFQNNRQRCRYAEVSEANFPIGSRVAEASCKTLVTQRIMRSSMCWKEQGDQAILMFRALLKNN